jgi:hypothetical protein
LRARREEVVEVRLRPVSNLSVMTDDTPTPTTMTDIGVAQPGMTSSS